jgi:hypothetical protein
MNTTPKQNLILLQLAVSGAATAGDFKFSMTPKVDREPLVQQGLITKTKQGRSIRFELTDRGWAHLDELEDIRLTKSPATAPLLEIFFNLTLGRLHATGETLAALHMAPTPVPCDDPDLQTDTGLAQRIREAYAKLSTGSPGCEIRLKHLKSALPHTDRESLDLCILGLVMAGRAQLRQIDDALAIDAEDRAAGIDLGGAARHLFRLTP